MRISVSRSAASAMILLVLPVLASPGGASAQTSSATTPPHTVTPIAPAGDSAPAASATPTAPARRPARVARAATPAERVEQRITQLHGQLHITAAEQPQWDQFAQVMRDNAAGMEHSFGDRTTKVSTMSATDNMNSYAQLAMEHAQDLQKLSTAFGTLYAALSPDQQKDADHIFAGAAERREARKK